MTEDEAIEAVSPLKTLPFCPDSEGLRAVARDLVIWCQGFQGWQPHQQALWIVQQIRNNWDQWHGSKLMREIFDQKFTLHAPDPMDRWKREETPAARFAGEQKPVWLAWAGENDTIMERARVAEKARDEKDQRVREFFGIHDFNALPWPQRWFAERELGYRLNSTQTDELNSWLSVVTEPHVVRKPGPEVRAAL
jgi:hypothetical protein